MIFPPYDNSTLISFKLKTSLVLLPWRVWRCRIHFFIYHRRWCCSCCKGHRFRKGQKCFVPLPFDAASVVGTRSHVPQFEEIEWTRCHRIPSQSVFQDHGPQIFIFWNKKKIPLHFTEWKNIHTVTCLLFLKIKQRALVKFIGLLENILTLRKIKFYDCTLTKP